MAVCIWDDAEDHGIQRQGHKMGNLKCRIYHIWDGKNQLGLSSDKAVGSTRYAGFTSQNGHPKTHYGALFIARILLKFVKMLDQLQDGKTVNHFTFLTSFPPKRKNWNWDEHNLLDALSFSQGGTLWSACSKSHNINRSCSFINSDFINLYYA